MHSGWAVPLIYFSSNKQNRTEKKDQVAVKHTDGFSHQISVPFYAKSSIRAKKQTKKQTFKNHNQPKEKKIFTATSPRREHNPLENNPRTAWIVSSVGVPHEHKPANRGVYRPSKLPHTFWLLGEVKASSFIVVSAKVGIAQHWWGWKLTTKPR